MTANAFRRIALGMDGATEGEHMGHPDFRVNGRIFATLQTADRAMVVLPPEHQSRFVAANPDTFAVEAGAWGRQGCTRVLLPGADPELVGEAVTLAWQHIHARLPARPRARRPRR